MKNYELKEAVTSADNKAFLQVAVTINSKDPNWVQPLDQDIESVFDPAKNELFNGGEAIRWLLYSGGKAIGRIAAFYNREQAAKESQPTGGCGFFECIDVQEAANVLFDAAREWLMAKGMEAMDGSINFGDRMSWWGVLVEGFTMPLYGMNYNPPYYAALFESYGFKNYFNQHSYLRPLPEDIKLNDFVEKKAQRLMDSNEYEFRSCAKEKSLAKIAEDFRKVYNSGWVKIDGVKALTSQHAMDMMKKMSPIVDKKMLIFGYHNGEPVGFFIMIPDLNQITYRFKGKFGFRQKLELIWKLKIAKSVDRLAGIVFGVAAEYQGKGVEAGMIRFLQKYTQDCRKANKEQYKTLEMMWIGDFNPVMMRVAESYVNATRHKMHTTYRYLFDREKPFERCPRIGTKPK